MAGPSYNKGRFQFTIDGESAGFCKKVSGGNVKAELEKHDAGPSNWVHKVITNLSYEDIKLEMSTSMAGSMWDRINQAFNYGHGTFSGEVVSANADNKAKRALVFRDAHIKELSMGPFDAADKKPSYVNLTLEPEECMMEKRNDEVLQGTFGAGHKTFLASNFAFTMGSLPTELVSKIDAVVVKMGVTKDEVGLFRKATKHPTKTEVGDITFYLSMAHAEPWENAFRKFVIDGHNSVADELQGAIELLPPNCDRSNPIGEIQLENCGFISCEQEALEANGEGIARLKVMMYVERVKCEFKGDM